MVVRRCSDANRFACSDLGTCRVGDLVDVNAGGALDDLLVHNGLAWTPQQLDLATRLNTARLRDLGDVNGSVSPQIGHVVQWNGTEWTPGIVLAGSGSFVPAQLAGAVLNDLGDVTTAGATTGQVLAKQGSGQWQGVTLAPGGGGGSLQFVSTRVVAPYGHADVPPLQGSTAVVGPVTATLDNPSPTAPMQVLRTCSGSGQIYVNGTEPGGYLVWEASGTGVAAFSADSREFWFAHGRSPGGVQGGGSFLPHTAIVPGGGTYSVQLSCWWEPDPTSHMHQAAVNADTYGVFIQLVGIVG